MKKILYLFGFLVVFVSCTTDQEFPEETNVNVKESMALRLSLEHMKRAALSDASGLRSSNTGLCFQFVYPVTLQYNTGSQITVMDYEQLLDVLLTETMAQHITAIGFPFNVVLYADNSTLTLTTEAEFQALLDNCGYNPVTVADVVALTDSCFTVHYPITLIVNDVPQTFNSQTEAENYFIANSSTIESVAVQFPLTVTLVDTNETLQVTNNFELIYLVNTTCGIN